MREGSKSNREQDTDGVLEHLDALDHLLDGMRA